MSNIDTKATRTWVSPGPPRSTLTEISNLIMAIRRRHNHEFMLEAATDHGSLSVLRHMARERDEISRAAREHGWSMASLEAELERRTTLRWAHKITKGWF